MMRENEKNKKKKKEKEKKVSQLDFNGPLYMKPSFDYLLHLIALSKNALIPSRVLEGSSKNLLVLGLSRYR